MQRRIISSDEEDTCFGRTDEAATPSDCAKSTYVSCKKRKCSTRKSVEQASPGQADNHQILPPCEQGEGSTDPPGKPVSPSHVEEDQSGSPSQEERQQSREHIEESMQLGTPSTRQVAKETCTQSSLMCTDQQEKGVASSGNQPAASKAVPLVMEVEEGLVINMTQSEDSAWDSELDSSSVTSTPGYKRGRHDTGAENVQQAVAELQKEAQSFAFKGTRRKASIPAVE